MYLFGLEGSGFIISLGLTLLISGTIMFYVLKRFQVIENSLIDNARVLQSFINKSQEQAINHNLASNIALESAKKQQYEINKRIEVSDDENESDAESDDVDNESYGSDSESDLESNNEKIKIIDNENNSLSNELVESVKIIAINDFEEFKNDKLLDVNNITEIDSSINSSNNDNSIKVIENTIVDDTIVDEKDEKATNFAKLKMPELKELVISKNLIDSETDINKLKKPELIKLLQNN